MSAIVFPRICVNSLVEHELTTQYDLLMTYPAFENSYCAISLPNSLVFFAHVQSQGAVCEICPFGVGTGLLCSHPMPPSVHAP